MQRLLFLIAFSLSLFISKAQTPVYNLEDSTIDISLQKKQHSLIVGFLPDRGRWDVVNYTKQLPLLFQGRNSDDVLTATVRQSVVVYVFDVMGSQQNKYVDMDNVLIKKSFLPQILKHPALLFEINSRDSTNKIITEQKRQEGEAYVQKIGQ